MPFDAAKAVAATFCWKIRFALTPLFGLDFPSLCVHPDDRSRFGRMVIDPAIVQKCTKMTQSYRMLELQSIPTSLSLFRNATSCPSFSPPATDIRRNMSDEKEEQTLLPKTLTSSAQRKFMGNINSNSSNSSGYGSSTEYSDSYCTSPATPNRTSFTPVNTPRSSGPYSGSKPGLHLTIPSPQEILSRVSLVPKKFPSEYAGGSDEDSGSSTDSTLYSDLSNSDSSTNTNTITDVDTDFGSPRKSPSTSYVDNNNTNNNILKRSHGHDGVNHGGNSSSLSPHRRRVRISAPGNDKRRSRKEPQSVLFAREVKAAHALLSLHMQNAATASQDGDQRDYNGVNSASCQYHSESADTRGRKRRRASA